MDLKASLSQIGPQFVSRATSCSSSKLSPLDAGVAAAEGGLDLAMPNGAIYWGTDGSKLVDMVNNGSIEETRLTDMATRIVASWYQMGQDVSACLLLYSVAAD